MKIAFLSDIHGNLKGLQTVFSDLVRNEVDEIIVLGDTLGYGEHSHECFLWTQLFADIHLQGNHEFGLFYKDRDLIFNEKACASMEETKKLFSEKELEIIKRFPIIRFFEELNICIAHDSFNSPGKWRYVFKKDAPEEIKHLVSQIGFLGHTHEPFIYGNINGDYPTYKKLQLKDDEKYLINVGSVGRMRTQIPTACYGLLEIGEEKHFELRTLTIPKGK